MIATEWVKVFNNAMQAMEELGGPSAQDYVDTMREIARIANERAERKNRENWKRIYLRVKAQMGARRLRG